MKRMNRVIIFSILLVLMLQVQPAEAGQKVHRVMQGETLFSIAHNYGVKVEQLLANNKYLRLPDRLSPGLLLVIPEPEKVEAPKFVVGKPVTQQPVASAPEFNDNQVQENQQEKQVTVKKSLQEVLAELFQEYKNIVFLNGSSKSNKISLSFDDGPSEVTSHQVLDILQQFNVKGTFFLLGQNVEKYPQVVARMVREGHVVAGHSWSHIQLEKASIQRIINEVAGTENAIFRVTGKRPALVRPPYGSLNREGLEYLQKNGYKVVNWSVDSLDWKYPGDGDQVIISTLRDVRGGSIILFHTLPGKEPSPIIAKVLPEIIHSLQSQGYEFFTVDQLLSISPYK